MWTRRQFRVWSIAFALLVMGLLAALPVFADPGIRMGPSDAPATGYGPFSAPAPAVLPATGSQSSAHPYHTLFELRQLEDSRAPAALPATGAQPATPSHHTMFELRQLEQGLAAPKPQSLVRPWVTVGQIPRSPARAGHSVADLRLAEASLAAPATLPMTGVQAAARSWHTVGEIPRLAAHPYHTMFELRQLEASLAG